MKPAALLSLVILALAVPALRAAEAAPLPVAVAPGDPALRYAGRWDRGDAAGPRCAWSGSAVAVRFDGTALNARIAQTGSNLLEVFVDGKPTATLDVRTGTREGTPGLFAVASGLAPGEHTVELVKRTEFFLGVVQVLGFQLPAEARLLPVPPAARRIEVIGDSISCGYGDEAASADESFTPDTENGAAAYGAVAARALGADYVCVAWSGKKLWPDNSILDYYGRTLPPYVLAGRIPLTGLGATWDFASWRADAVVINLGTNDYYRETPDPSGWAAAYKALLARLRRQYPQAAIYCATGPMLTDEPADRKPASTLRAAVAAVVADARAAGDQQVRVLDFGTQDPANGLGAFRHPSLKTQRLMGEQLEAALRRDLGW
ncbi:MAG TPA: SGNH/GDSL hydrolase family protein [Candidatus Methylacidiphilales bacterium]